MGSSMHVQFNLSKSSPISRKVSCEVVVIVSLFQKVMRLNAFLYPLVILE